MKNVHLLLPDLFLPVAFASDVSADLELPVLGKLLARAQSEKIPTHGVEQALFAAFGMAVQGDIPMAAVSAQFDGLPSSIYLRADPVNLRLQRDQMLLSQGEVTAEEAAQFCASLNEYFAGQGMTFHVPHPLRWYVELAQLPEMRTRALSEVIGSNVRGALPQGTDAPRWHQLFNEIQMLLFAHPLNEARESRGESPINSLWFWGGSAALGQVRAEYDVVVSDDVLGEMFAAAAGLSHQQLEGKWQAQAGRQLLMCTSLSRCLQAGDLHAWRMAMQRLEFELFQPLFHAISSRQLERLQIDVMAGESSLTYVITRADLWRFWRTSKPLAKYSLV